MEEKNINEKVIAVFAKVLKDAKAVEKESANLLKRVSPAHTIISALNSQIHISLKENNDRNIYNLCMSSDFIEGVNSAKLSPEEVQQIIEFIFTKILEATERRYVAAKEAHHKEILK